MFFYGVDATKKPTAAPLGADNTYRSPFLRPQEESDLRAFFRMSRSAFSLVTSRLSRAISSCSGKTTADRPASGAAALGALTRPVFEGVPQRGIFRYEGIKV